MLDTVHYVARLPGRAGRSSTRSIRHLEAAWDLLTLTRQGPPLLQPRPSAQHRLPRDGPHRTRHRPRDTPRARTIGDHGRQHQLAAAPRRPDGAGDDRVRAVTTSPSWSRRSRSPGRWRRSRSAGALAQQNAEALAGIAFTQLVNPGAPVIYGGFTSNVDMQSGAPCVRHARVRAHGDDQPVSCAVGTASRTAARNACAANALDAQAAYESVFSLWGAVMGGVELHDARRRLDGGWPARQPRQDAARRRPAADGQRRSSTPCVVDDDTLAIDTIDEVGPRCGHFFGTAHTQARFRDAFYRPLLSDWRNYETWDEAGRPTADQKVARAHRSLPRRLRAAGHGPRP